MKSRPRSAAPAIPLALLASAFVGLTSVGESAEFSSDLTFEVQTVPGQNGQPECHTSSLSWSNPGQNSFYVQMSADMEHWTTVHQGWAVSEGVITFPVLTTTPDVVPPPVKPIRTVSLRPSTAGWHAAWMDVVDDAAFPAVQPLATAPDAGCPLIFTAETPTHRFASRLWLKTNPPTTVPITRTLHFITTGRYGGYASDQFSGQPMDPVVTTHTFTILPRTATAQNAGVYSEPFDLNATLPTTILPTSESMQDGLVHTTETRLLPVEFKIWNGQDAADPVPEDKKYSVGAFTVANLNDTDGDGGANHTPDKDDNEVTGEKDLMQLKTAGYAGMPGKVKLTVKQGKDRVKFWETKEKKTAIPLDANGAVFFDIPAGGLDKTLWIEATAASGAVRDIEIWEDYQDAQGNLQDGLDKVKATAVWAEFVASKKANADTVWSAASQGLKDFFTQEVFKFGPSYDTGWMAAQYAMGFEFKTLPPGLGSENSVTFDVGRQHEGNIWSIANSATQAVPGESRSWPQQPDESNDDGKDDDEDAKPDNDRVYSIDGPGFKYEAPKLYNEAVMKFNFKEFVRVWFKTDDLKGNNSDGSRCSDKFEWNAQGWVTKTAGQTPNFPAYAPKAGKPNDVGTGNVPTTAPQP